MRTETQRKATTPLGVHLSFPLWKDGVWVRVIPPDLAGVPALAILSKRFRFSGGLAVPVAGPANSAFAEPPGASATVFLASGRAKSRPETLRFLHLGSSGSGAVLSSGVDTEGEGRAPPSSILLPPSAPSRRTYSSFSSISGEGGCLTGDRSGKRAVPPSARRRRRPPSEAGRRLAPRAPVRTASSPATATPTGGRPPYSSVASGHAA